MNNTKVDEIIKRTNNLDNLGSAFSKYLSRDEIKILLVKARHRAIAYAKQKTNL
jgi:hypothetical protein